MSSPKKKKKQRDLEKIFVKNVRKQLYPDGSRAAEEDWDDAKMASQATQFKSQHHANLFDALREAWDDLSEDEDEDEEEEDEASMDELKPLAVLEETTRSTTEEPDTEALIMDRHVYELLYNLLLASHHNMAQRKMKLMGELYRNEQIKKKENRRKKTEIIQKYLPENERTMARTIKHIFDEIVKKHYEKWSVKQKPKSWKKFPLFVEIEKEGIIKYIKTACKLSFEMLFAQNELSFFPLLFTDPRTSYIAPVVRYHKTMKAWNKAHAKKTSLTPTLEPQQRKRLYSHARASSMFHEGMANRSFASFEATQILYYTFPGIIDAKKHKIYAKAETFTHDNPAIFLRHDMNWIFTDDFIRKTTITEYRNSTKVDNESEDDNPFVKESEETDPYRGIVSPAEMTMEAVKENNDIIKHTDYTPQAQLIQDWATLKAQNFNQLTESLLDSIMELEEEKDDGTDDIKSAEDESDDGDDEDDDLEEYNATKKAAQFLLELMTKCRYIMGMKVQRSTLLASHNVPYLNMTKIYKAFTTERKEDPPHAQFLERHKNVKVIVDRIFEEVLKTEAFKQFEFVTKDDELNQKLHEFIAQCCQLLTSVLHHEWDLYPDLTQLADSKCLTTFDERIHIKDKTFSMDDSNTKIDYLAFPGIITKADLESFGELYEKNAMDKDKIYKTLIYQITVCLNDDL